MLKGDKQGFQAAAGVVLCVSRWFEQHWEFSGVNIYMEEKVYRTANTHKNTIQH